MREIVTVKLLPEPVTVEAPDELALDALMSEMASAVKSMYTVSVRWR